VIRILFVCMGNICRSPTAQGVFAALVRDAGLDHAISCDSAGTSHYHIGNSPDPRACRAAAKRGVEIGHLRARKAQAEDFAEFDIVLAMDRANYRNLVPLAGEGGAGKLRLFLEFAPGHGEDVPDPYYGGGDGFERVLDICEAAGRGLLGHLIRTHGLEPRRGGAGQYTDSSTRFSSGSRK
jgi:protein-tyrosine phosphatase